MAKVDADRNLLFGLVALQTGLIDQARLVAAFHAWTLDKSKRLADVLVSQGALDAAGCAAVDSLVEFHLRAHGGEVEKSLASLPVGHSTRDELHRIGDADVQASLAPLAAAPAHTAEAGLTVSLSDLPPEAGMRYRTLRLHEGGGLGEVYVAEDTELHRQVALKQIRASHADDPSSRARFVLEAEITGGLEHPGIVPVYGCGTTSDGRPFYAMRFIRGGNLRDAIARFHGDEALKTSPGARALELRKLLRRFLDVCNAIEYAHTRGVLHRDLKPGNVIVGKFGETLVVDWGLAKPLGKSSANRLDEHPLKPSSGSNSAETLPGRAIGTPSYMSPEQAQGDLEALGPRSDVYSLGATLYSVLTGKMPFEGEDLGLVLQRVVQGEFAHPRKHDPAIDPALEAVCLKAMSLHAADRYATPRALAEDVDRWLADEPVTAWREPFSRRARRWARRNRTFVTSAGVAFLAGVVGLAALAAVQSRDNRRLQDEKDRTTTALREETKAKQATQEALAEKGRALAQSEESRRRAEAVLRFLRDDILAATRPEGEAGGLGKDVKVREALEAAEPKIDQEFKGEPLVEADVRYTLGATYFYLGDAARAIPQLERAMALRRAQLGPNHPDTLSSRNNLAVAYSSAGRNAEAVALNEETLALRTAHLGPSHPDTITSRNNLAETYSAAGRVAEAIKLHEETLALSEGKLGRDHPDTLTSRNNLAAAYAKAGRLVDAIKLHQTTLALSEAKLGPDNPDTLTIRNNLAAAYLAAGRVSDAIKLHERTLKMREAKLGPAHPDTITSGNNLAVAYTAAGRTNEAIALWKRTLPQARKSLGPRHATTLQIADNTALALEMRGHWAEAAHLRLDLLEQKRKLNGSGSPALVSDLSALGIDLLRQGHWAQAEPVLRECLAIRERTRPDDWTRFDTMSQLGGALLAQRKFAEAEPLLVRAYEGLRAHESKIPAASKPRLSEAALRIARLYEATGQTAKLATWKAKLHPTELPDDVFARP